MHFIFEIVVYRCSCWHLPNLATLSDLTIKNKLENDAECHWSWLSAIHFFGSLSIIA